MGERIMDGLLGRQERETSWRRVLGVRGRGIRVRRRMIRRLKVREVWMDSIVEVLRWKKMKHRSSLNVRRSV